MNVDESKTMILRLLRKCPVYEFRTYILTLENVDSPKLLDLDSIISTANDKYAKMQLAGSWKVPKDNRSFIAKKDDDKDNNKDTKDSKGNYTPNDPKTHDRQGIPINRTPPKKGKPTSRKNAATGRTEDYCKPCNRWGNHGTDKHDEWKAKQKERRDKQKAKKKSSDSDSSGTPSSDTASRDSAATPPTVSRGNLASVTGIADPF